MTSGGCLRNLLAPLSAARATCHLIERFSRMTTERSNTRRRPAKPRSRTVRQTELQAKQAPAQVVIEVQESGEWIAAAELKERSLGALEKGSDLIFNLGNVSHLDASALQILLAVDIEQKKRGGHLELANVSTDLQQWFQHAGSMERLSMIGPTTNER